MIYILMIIHLQFKATYSNILLLNVCSYSYDQCRMLFLTALCNVLILWGCGAEEEGEGTRTRRKKIKCAELAAAAVVGLSRSPADPRLNMATTAGIRPP